jgi:tol-pal system protein YbgF
MKRRMRKTAALTWPISNMKPIAAFRIALPLAVVLLCAAFPARAALFEDEEARRAILDLRTKVEQVERTTSQQLTDLAQRVERLEQVTRGQLTLQNDLEKLREEIARLRGQLEEQTNELVHLQVQQRDAMATVDSRLKRFEPVAVQIDGQTVNVDQNERRAYEASLAPFRSGDFRGALTAFQQFQTQYPESPYGPSVAFWIGSAQFALKDYKAAIATNLSFITRHPDHPRVADAQLNLGYAQIESGDRREGRKTLQAIIDRFPDSQAAKNARDRIATLR